MVNNHPQTNFKIEAETYNLRAILQEQRNCNTVKVALKTPLIQYEEIGPIYHYTIGEED